MKLWRALLLTAMVAVCAASLHAGPRVIIHDPFAPLPTPVELTFTFLSDDSGGGVSEFSNASGVNWFNLYVFVPPPQPLAPITCGVDDILFSACTILPGQMGFFATIAFTGPSGINNGQIFFADLGSDGWTPDAQFLAIANAPEPATLFLLVGGTLPFLARRRFF